MYVMPNGCEHSPPNKRSSKVKIITHTIPLTLKEYMDYTIPTTLKEYEYKLFSPRTPSSPFA
jgi:hypothetical protein